MISLIVTNYNTWQLTERCIRAAIMADNHLIVKEYIIVDDNSDEFAPQSLQQLSNTKIIRNITNIGYVASVNIGFSAANYPICLLLDSDAYPITDFSTIAMLFEKKADLGILGFRLEDEQGNATGNAEPEPNFWSVLLGQGGYAKFEKYLVHNKALAVFSCAMAVRKTAFQAVNGFDESFDFLDADIDFCMRINRSQHWKIETDPTIRMFHIGGGSPQLTSKRVIRFYRNRFHLLRKHNLLPMPLVIKFFVLSRLTAEYLALGLAGSFRFNKTVKADKMLARKQLITQIFNY
ncbi:MAG: glycosyltransferase [Verrucomicrobia bacterium]|nr:glycosyltransferase [Cytophagales bacterium]